MSDAIVVRGAREHNLKNLTVSIPKGRLTVVTGPSGSGKSSLAFDTLYAEGQRRYIESLSSYARRFLSQLPKPDVDFIEGLCPAIAIREQASNRNPRSTVGTLTDVYDFLRVLFAASGTAHCPVCDRVIRAHSPAQIAEQVLAWDHGTRFMVLAPVVRGQPGDHANLLEKLRADGFARVRIDGATAELQSTRSVSKKGKHDIDVVVDRLSVREGIRQRLSETIELCLSLADGRVLIAPTQGEEQSYTSRFACPEGHATLPELSPRVFSYNQPVGACEACGGLGFTLPLAERTAELARLKQDKEVFDLLDRDLADFSTAEVCSACHGARLRPEVRAVRIEGRGISEICADQITEAGTWLRSVASKLPHAAAVGPVTRAIDERLKLLEEVGLGYLSLSRIMGTLSTGEAQRVRLATQIGLSLSGVLYVLDEPTTGLHPADTVKLLRTLQALRDHGNTLVVVEHEPALMKQADHIIDLGPGAGDLGGELVAQGSLASLDGSVTADFLSGRRVIDHPSERRRATERIGISGASLNNLNSVTAAFGVGSLNCVTGVSGSGKSTLVMQTLLPIAEARISGTSSPHHAASVTGLESIERVSVVDSSPIGRTPRSNPATYLGLFGPLRQLFSSLPESRARGYGPGRFSFNVKGGRCEACRGDGVQRLQMSFLPDAFVACPVCKGLRYNPETLDVRYRGASMADVLEMPVSDALAFFEAVPALRQRLEALHAVGLGYLQLGRSATTLSGGEAQRIKLARDLGRHRTASTLYLLDEPTRGLHFVDVERLVEILHSLVDRGHTVIVIEHHLDVIKNADHIVDLGPGAGPFGGHVVAQGTPEEVANHKDSRTGQFLRELL